MDGKFCKNIENEMEKTETLWSSDHFIEINQKFALFFENQQFCDVTLISADDEYKVMAHKCVLASVSKYFFAMFGGSLSESNANEVKLSQIDGVPLKLIVNFIYNGIITLSADTVEALLIGSHLIELHSLETLCCSYIQKNIDVSNCLGISFLAERYNYPELYDAAKLYAYENFVTLRDEDEFCTLPFDKLCDIVSNDELRVQSEEDVFYSIMAWINYDKDNRMEFFEKLLNYVRFLLLPPRSVATIIEPLCESFESFRIVSKVFKWHAVPDLRSTIFSNVQSKIRNIKDVIVAICGCSTSDRDLNVGLYYPGLKEWIYTKWPAVPHSRVDLIYSVLHDKLLIADSNEHDYPICPVDCLHLKTLKWMKFPELSNDPSALISLNGRVYTFNDSNVYKLGKSLEKWETLDIPSHISANICSPYSTYKEVIYFYNCDNYVTYNTINNIWKQIAFVGHIPDFRIIGVHIIRHLLCDFLIEITKDHAYVYNLETRTLVIQNSISYNQTCTNTALHDKKIIIYGKRQFYEYDVFENRMQAMQPLINESVDIVLTNNNGGVC